MAVDYFIKFDGIKGESADAKHKDEIDVEAWSWGETNVGGAAHGGGAGAGKVSMQDFQFVMRWNTASTELMKACATGQHMPEATLTARRRGQGQQDFLIIKMMEVIVTSVAPSAEAETSIREIVTLRFAKVDLSYSAQKGDGSLDTPTQFRYDINANKPL